MIEDIERPALNTQSHRRRNYAFAAILAALVIAGGLWGVHLIRNAPPTSGVLVEDAACFVEPTEEEAACSVPEAQTDVPDLSGGLALPGSQDLLALAPSLDNESGAIGCLHGAEGDSCLRFPTISGLNLMGDEMTLPADFSGDWHLVIVPFSDEQQVNAQTWLPLAETLAAQTPALSYYNVPIFPDITPPIRLVIRAGMTLAISDPSLQALSITVFLDDRETFLSALEIADVEAMQVFLLDASGVVYWRGVGEYDESQANALKLLVENVNE